MPLYERLKIEGLMPERALLRLKRGGIALYRVRKTQKNVLFFEVKRKELEKVFAIYPNVCYNIEDYHPYTVTRVGGVGLARLTDFCKKRVGLLLGGLAFCALTLAADSLVLGVEVVGIRAYEREALAALAEHGVRKFSTYPEGEADLVCAKLLTLDGVEFCSVQKIGGWVRVELRGSSVKTPAVRRGDMLAEYEGEIVSLTALRGTPLKAVGQKVTLGEPLVGGWFSPAEGEKIEVAPIAYAEIACRYEGIIEAASEEEAFAQAYLGVYLTGEVTLVEQSVSPLPNGYEVRIEYRVLQKINV